MESAETQEVLNYAPLRPPQPRPRSRKRRLAFAVVLALSVAGGAAWYFRPLRVPLLAAVVPVRSDPPAATVVLLKSERRMELWLRSDGVWRKTRDYGLARVRGMAGPKLAAHDGQVPEGVYGVRSVSPLVLDYPSEFDLRMARRDMRGGLGDGFTVTGSAVQADAAVWQDLGAVLGTVGREQVRVIVAPNDLRIHPAVKSGRPVPGWVPELYGQLAQALQTNASNAAADTRAKSR